jgi:hypothetical protein
MELSNAAGRCYALAGRLRNAALMRSDVADALAARGDDAAAAALYERQARLFLREAWHWLAALVLRKLARSQQVMDKPVLRATQTYNELGCVMWWSFLPRTAEIPKQRYCTGTLINCCKPLASS